MGGSIWRSMRWRLPLTAATYTDRVSKRYGSVLPGSEIARGLAALLLMLSSLGTPLVDAQPTTPPLVASPAAPEVVAELTRLVEVARRRFEARDAEGVLSMVSERYRSSGFTKPAVRQQLLTMFGLYQELRGRVTVDAVQVVNGATWVYTTGEISGRLPFMGWVSVLAWERQPEVVRREAGTWRLFGFQD